MITDPQIPAYINAPAIRAEYAPYHLYPEFTTAYAAAFAGMLPRYPGTDGVGEQAWDRGLEAGRRVRRAAEWIAQNVGMN